MRDFYCLWRLKIKSVSKEMMQNILSGMITAWFLAPIFACTRLPFWVPLSQHELPVKDGECHVYRL